MPTAPYLKYVENACSVYTQISNTSPRLTTAITNLDDLQVEAFNKRLRYTNL